jgi:phage FluMu protein Com
MPIRFRCWHCNQLLGIARRKAGTQVQCPTCRNQVTVPETDQPDDKVPAAAPPLFERDDFEAYLHEAAGASLPGRSVPPPPVPPPPAPLPAAAPGAFEPHIPPPVSVPAEVGLIITPTRATVLTVVVIILLAVAFGAGLLVGRYL